MLIGDVEHPVPVELPIDEIGHGSHGKQIVGLEQGDPLGARDPFSGLDLLHDREESRVLRPNPQLSTRGDHRPSQRRKTSDTLCPPKPNEFVRPARTGCLTAPSVP